MHKKNYSLFLLVLLVGLMAGCKHEEHKGTHKAGRLEYRITYLNADQGNFDPSLLPRKMILEFNKEFSTNTIDGFMGMFRLSNLTYFNKRKSTTYLKVLDKNYVFTGNRNELMCCFDIFENLKIEKDTTQLLIAGLQSQHAKVFIPTTNETFDIFYTYDIALEHPNVTNPYLDIDGVLTDFVLYMGPYKMRFVAEKFIPGKEPKEDLRIPESAVELTREEMIFALDRLMQ
ncbi:MAG: hypothetical protein IPM71_13410 [Bacteroidota bacterium]|nr:MAG: hypothetical protein IPM71_13410 [Bacteroidota bacterium]